MFFPDESAYRLLTVIVNRGKGSKVLRFVKKLGVTCASCLYGKGTVKSKPLELMGMDEVNREIVLIIIRANREQEILTKMNEKFQFNRPHHGIAFTISLAGILQMNESCSLRWLKHEKTRHHNSASGQTLVLIVVNKGLAKTVVQMSQDAGFYGGTIIKAKGSASELHIVLDMIVEPEKEVILMLTEKRRVHELVRLLDHEFKFREKNTGMIITADVHQAIGLFQDRNGEEN